MDRARGFFVALALLLLEFSGAEEFIADSDRRILWIGKKSANTRQAGE
jgi:hypothetical protein